MFKKLLLKFVRLDPNSVFNMHEAQVLKLLTKLRLGLSHLNDHKFKQSLKACITPICSSEDDIETTTCFLLHSPCYAFARQSLSNEVNILDSNILEHN